MSPEVMRSQMDAHQVASLFHDSSVLGNRECGKVKFGYCLGKKEA
jgi:hypothetical protein